MESAARFPSSEACAEAEPAPSSAHEFWRRTAARVSQTLLSPARHRRLITTLDPLGAGASASAAPASPLEGGRRSDAGASRAAEDAGRQGEVAPARASVSLSPPSGSLGNTRGDFGAHSASQAENERASAAGSVAHAHPAAAPPEPPFEKTGGDSSANANAEDLLCSALDSGSREGRERGEELAEECRGAETWARQPQDQNAVKQTVKNVRLGNVLFSGTVISEDTGVTTAEEKGEARFFTSSGCGRGANAEDQVLLYVGDFHGSRLEGQGRFSWRSGAVYDGQVARGRRHGFGTLFSSKGDKEYTGTWKDGQRDGEGTFRYDAEGICAYRGAWRNNLRHGWGRQEYSGGVYEGQWRAGKRHGAGQMVWTELGVQYADDDVAESQLRLNRYEGSFKRGARHGFGLFWYANGSRYEGVWRGNKKHGRAHFVNEAGAVHEALFENDRVVRISSVKPSFALCDDLPSGLSKPAPSSSSSASKKSPSPQGSMALALPSALPSTASVHKTFFSSLGASSARRLVALDDIFLLELCRGPAGPGRPAAPPDNRTAAKHFPASGDKSPLRGGARGRRCLNWERDELKALSAASWHEETERAFSGTYKWILRNLKTLRRTYALYRRIACFPGQDPLCMSFLQFWLLAADARLLTADRPLSRILRALEVATQSAPTPSECLISIRDGVPSLVFCGSAKPAALWDANALRGTPPGELPNEEALSTEGSSSPCAGLNPPPSRMPLSSIEAQPPSSVRSLQTPPRAGSPRVGASAPLYVEPVEQRPLVFPSFLRALVLLAQDDLLRQEAVRARSPRGRPASSSSSSVPSRATLDVALSSCTVSLLQFYETCFSAGRGERRGSATQSRFAGGRGSSSVCSQRSPTKRTSSFASRRSSLSRKMASPHTFRSPALDALRPFTSPEILQALAPLQPWLARRFACAPQARSAGETKAGGDEVEGLPPYPLGGSPEGSSQSKFSSLPRMTGSVFLRDLLSMLHRWGLLKKADDGVKKTKGTSKPPDPSFSLPAESPEAHERLAAPPAGPDLPPAPPSPAPPGRLPRAPNGPSAEPPGPGGRGEKGGRRRGSLAASRGDAKAKSLASPSGVAPPEPDAVAPSEETGVSRAETAGSSSAGSDESTSTKAGGVRSTPQVSVSSLLAAAFTATPLAVTPVEVLYFLFHFLPEFHDQEDALRALHELREEKKRRHAEKAGRSAPSAESGSSRPPLSLAQSPVAPTGASAGLAEGEEREASSFAAEGSPSQASKSGQKVKESHAPGPALGRSAGVPAGSAPATHADRKREGREEKGVKPRGVKALAGGRRGGAPRVTITGERPRMIPTTANAREELSGSATGGHKGDDSRPPPPPQENASAGRSDAAKSGVAGSPGDTPAAADGDPGAARDRALRRAGSRDEALGTNETGGAGSPRMTEGPVRVTPRGEEDAEMNLERRRPFATPAVERSYLKLVRKILGKQASAWVDLVNREVTAIEMMMVLLKIVEFKTPVLLEALMPLPLRLSLLASAIAEHEAARAARLGGPLCLSSEARCRPCWPVASRSSLPPSSFFLSPPDGSAELPASLVASLLAQLPPERQTPPSLPSPSCALSQLLALMQKSATLTWLPGSSARYSLPVAPRGGAAGALGAAPSGGVEEGASEDVAAAAPGVSGGSLEGEREEGNRFWQGFDGVRSICRACGENEWMLSAVVKAPLVCVKAEEDESEASAAVREADDDCSDEENEESEGTCVAHSASDRVERF